MTCHNIVWAFAALSLATSALGADPTKAAPKLIREAMLVNREGGKPAELVLRSEEAVKKTLTDPEIAKLGKVDFAKQMVVVVRTGTTQYFGVKLNVEKLTVSDKDDMLTVQWKYRPYFGGAAPPMVSGNITLVAVVDEHDGKVKFQKEVHQFKGPFPPSAPPRRP